LAVEKSRKQRLRACESVLLEHMEEFVRVGMALKEIRDDRLYEVDGHASFKAYLKSAGNRFGIKQAHAYRLMEAAELRMKLPVLQTGESRWTEGSVRELKRLGSPNLAKSVAGTIVKEAEKDGKKLTSGLVRKHVDQRLGVSRKPKPAKLPEFSDIIFRWVGRLSGLADLLDSVPQKGLNYFAKNEPEMTKDLVDAIERVQKSLERVWATLP